MKIEEIEKLPYRDNICCIVYKDNKFLIKQLKNWPSHLWKFPQGGVGNKEQKRVAALRELEEELSIKKEKLRIVAWAPFFHRYEWDEESIKLAGYKWKGQK